MSGTLIAGTATFAIRAARNGSAMVLVVGVLKFFGAIVLALSDGPVWAAVLLAAVCAAVAWAALLSMRKLNKIIELRTRGLTS